MPKDHYIELVGRIVRLIEALRDEPDGLSLQDLAVRTGYVKSSIHRILHSLKRHGYMEQQGPAPWAKSKNIRDGFRIQSRTARPMPREVTDLEPACSFPRMSHSQPLPT